jgi:GT2 family glycosyltransferase
VGQAAGACLLVRRPDFEALGGFDAGFHPVYFEDVDLCRRLADRGRRVLHVPGARFGHLGGESDRRLDAQTHESAWFGNLNRYAARHHGPGAALALRLLTPAALALRLAAVGRPGGGGRFGRRRRAAAYARVFLRSLRPWPPASPSTS